ncbi:hypothetical protein L7F22_008027 [Adiantum nelumboides]|nr:hypothetical protein [Adiantum nelumboides]
MGPTEFKAYARRRKVKKEGPGENSDPGGLTRGRHITEDDRAGRLLSLELDVAEALADFWRMAHRLPQEHEALRWPCKRRRTALIFKKDSVVPSNRVKEEPEDALSAVKKNRSGSTIGRDSFTSDRDEIESLRCSKDSSLFESRAQSPSSPLPSLPGPLQTSGDMKSAFQRVLPLAPCLVTVKTEIEDMHCERLAMGHRQMSTHPKAKTYKSIAYKAAVKMEPKGEHDACSEGLEVKSVAAAENHEAGPLSLIKAKSALNEKEKEARRLRRIQANRESARQTIRKKQVLCEDLTRKASTLTLENESMRQKRDSLLKELISLKVHNHHLKQQLEVRSSGDSGQDSVEASPKMPSDSANIPASQAPSCLSYAGMPPPAFIWAMAAASAAAAAVNQARTHNSQEIWDPSFALQHQNGLFVLPSLPVCKQTSVPEVIEQTREGACSGDGSPTSTDLSKKERDSVCAKSSALEVHCGDSLRKAALSCLEYANGDLSRKSSCDLSTQAGGCLLPQATAATKPELNALPGIAASSKSKNCSTGWKMAQGAASGYSYSGSVAGFLERNPQALVMKGYAAMVAAEARQRRKELTRSKFSRARAMRPAAVS